MKMDDSRLCKVAFLVQCRDRLGWCKGVRIRCADIGIRPPHPVTEPSSYKEEAFHAQRAIDADKAHMEALIMTAKPNSRKESTYFSIKHKFIVEPYILQAKDGHLCRMLATFRTGSLWL